MKKVLNHLALSAMLLAFYFPAQAQQPKKVPRIGYLAPVFPCSGSVPSLEAFRQGLRDFGYVEDKNITIECAQTIKGSVGLLRASLTSQLL